MNDKFYRGLGDGTCPAARRPALDPSRARRLQLRRRFSDRLPRHHPYITHIVVVDVVVGAEDVERDVANGLDLELRGRALAVDVDRCNAVLRRQGVG